MSQPTVSDVVVAMLHAYGIKTIFGLISTSILDLFDALARDGGIRLIPTQHEQGAAFMADGYARVTGKPGVLLISIGPGSTNALTGVAQAYHESSPVVVLCSEATSHVHGRGRSNFHEVDQVALFRPITKWAVRAERAERVPELLRRAFQVAVSGRPGPVYLGLPKDFLLAPAPALDVSALDPVAPTRVQADGEAIDRALSLLLEARHPFILAGGGVLWSGARDALRRLAQRLAAPVAATPWHRGIIPDDHPLGVGQLGNTGTRAALELAAEADLLLVVGSTLSELTT
ncbi:MAG TPA: thiamine pyrophosphate-binding protein, partial [Candidatus Binatia bacterium]|nr:thiamine pyrophosphate-binding protein [Candidatus Binatia bacterium]